jgi:hypothetical protein
VGNLDNVGLDERRWADRTVIFFEDRQTRTCLQEEHDARTWPGWFAKPDRELKQQRRWQLVAAGPGQGVAECSTLGLQKVGSFGVLGAANPVAQLD